MNNTKKIIGKLNHLLSITNDGKQGYENAAKDIKDVSLQQMFRQYSLERGRYAAEITDEINSLGGSPDQSGGPLGALHRVWMDIKAAITSGDRDAILNACITGEEAAVKSYKEVLQDSNITGRTHEIISHQLGAIQAALNSIRSLVPTIKS
jgi:uncharacterized protein (TIGR02284 family)